MSVENDVNSSKMSKVRLWNVNEEKGVYSEFNITTLLTKLFRILKKSSEHVQGKISSPESHILVVFQYFSYRRSS